MRSKFRIIYKFSAYLENLLVLVFICAYLKFIYFKVPNRTSDGMHGVGLTHSDDSDWQCAIDSSIPHLQSITLLS